MFTAAFSVEVLLHAIAKNLIFGPDGKPLPRHYQEPRSATRAKEAVGRKESEDAGRGGGGEISGERRRPVTVQCPCVRISASSGVLLSLVFLHFFGFSLVFLCF